MGCIRKEKSLKPMTLALYLNKLETSKRIDPKVSTRMETIEIRT